MRALSGAPRPHPTPDCRRRAVQRFASTQPARSIEIEAKFPFTEEDVRRIASRGVQRATKVFTDRYWDNRPRNYPLTTSDIWLRQRDAAWEIKVPVGFYYRSRAGDDVTSAPSAVDRYKELTNEAEISAFLRDRQFLRAAAAAAAAAGETASLERSLLADAFAAFCCITTERRTYECEGVTVTFDRATPLGYSVGELELLVDAAGDAAAAERRIRSFARQFSLPIESRMPGKVLEQIRRSSPEHWAALQASGLLRSKNVEA